MLRSAHMLRQDNPQPLAPQMFFGLRCILEACPNCGNPVPINGMLRAVPCPSCLSKIELPASLWHDTFQMGTLQLLDQGSISPTSMTVKHEAARLSVSVARSPLPAPACPHCAAFLPAAANLAAWPAFQLRCQACNRDVEFASPVLQLPPGPLILTHVIATETDSPALPPGALPAPQPSRHAPVVLSCPRCTAGLEIDETSKRTTPCTYCGAAVYLPDALWRELHPAKTSLQWTAVVRTDAQFLRQGERAHCISTLLGGIVTSLVLGCNGIFLSIHGTVTGEMGEAAFGLAWLAVVGLIMAILCVRMMMRSSRRRAVIAQAQYEV